MQGRESRAEPGARSGRVCVATGTAAEDALAEALERGGLWPLLAAATAGGGGPSAVRVLVLPDLATFERDGLCTDPALVERLVDLLAERGHTAVAVAGSTGGDRLAGGFEAVAARAGLGGHTPAGRPYARVDLSDELVPAPMPDGCVLAGTGLARAWVEADVRIAFPKCRTHEEHGYALGLLALLQALPLRDKAYHYRRRQKPWDLCLELVRHTPAHFTVVDAWRSADGLAPAPERLRETRTVVAGADAVLVDWVTAVKMGLDPQVSRVNARALAERGLPAERQLDGDLSPFPGFRTVHPLVADSYRALRDAGGASAALAAATGAQGAAGAPARVRGGLRALLGRLAASADENAAARAWLAWVNYAAASLGQSVEAWRTLYDKGAVLREDVPLALDLSAYGPEDYEAVPGYLLPLEALVRATPPDAHGLRWRYLEGSVLCEYGRVLPVPFDAFVGKVDIARAVQCMKDYMGGRCVAVARDAQGRVVHQAERTRYLPQPNWLVLSGAPLIDVGKLEKIVRGEREQRIFWRTVRSDNGSAAHDDGIVTFAAEGGGTRVTVLARQQFALPPFWQAMRLELAPEVKDALVGREYQAYLEETLTQFQARWEGLDLQVGREGRRDDGPPDPAPAVVGAAAARLGRAVRELLRAATGASGSPPPEVDAEGFRHFTPAPDEPGVPDRRARAARWAVDAALRRGPQLRDFLGQLRDAALADLGRRPQDRRPEDRRPEDRCPEDRCPEDRCPEDR